MPNPQLVGHDNITPMIFKRFGGKGVISDPRINGRWLHCTARCTKLCRSTICHIGVYGVLPTAETQVVHRVQAHSPE